MHWIDIAIIATYVAGVLAVGVYFLRKNKNEEDYYVSGRRMSSYHIGLSVVATDVGGGFSIGLGGLGFAMGLSGSWLLFTGLIGAWLTAVVLIPYVHRLGRIKRLLTFPQVFRHHYGRKVALIAAIISAIGYLGFTSAQILAGAKLAISAIDVDLTTALLIMGVVTVIYTVIGGMNAVIHTDTIQWIILMGGLILIGLPIALHAVGGMSGVREVVSGEMLAFNNVSVTTLINWAITIIPIWFVGMTLYQRIYASRTVRGAQRAWFFAGLLEWPLMAFMGVGLGLIGRVAAEQGLLPGGDVATMDPETGLPMLIRHLMPIGFMGLMLAAYFSAILSTADSCLMAASGNVVTDLIRSGKSGRTHPRFLGMSQLVTLILGAVSLVLALSVTDVLAIMLDSYAVMVSGLFVPVLGILFWRKRSAAGAAGAMLSGGGLVILLTVGTRRWDWQMPYGLDPIVFAITLALVTFIVLTVISPSKQPKPKLT